MIDYTFHVSKVKTKADLERARQASTRATMRAVDRWGLFVENRATILAPVNDGDLRRGIYKSDVEYDTATGTASVTVGGSAAHTLYVEMGFQGHFVPFHIADGLYNQALRKWGWRIPSPEQIKNPKPGRRYLIPRGRRSPVWGVFVKGEAQPFLQPAYKELFDSGLYLTILEDEYQREFAKL